MGMGTSELHIWDFSALSIKHLSSIPEGAPFIDGCELFVRTTVNTYPLLIALTGKDAFRAIDFSDPPSRKVASLDAGLFTDFSQESPLISIDKAGSLRGQCVMSNEMGMGICVDLDTGGTDKPEPGRLVYFPSNGASLFHDNDLQFAMRLWKLAWRHENGAGIMLLTMGDSET